MPRRTLWQSCWKRKFQHSALPRPGLSCGDEKGRGSQETILVSISSQKPVEHMWVYCFWEVLAHLGAVELLLQLKGNNQNLGKSPYSTFLSIFLQILLEEDILHNISSISYVKIQTSLSSLFSPLLTPHSSSTAAHPPKTHCKKHFLQRVKSLLSGSSIGLRHPHDPCLVWSNTFSHTTKYTDFLNWEHSQKEEPYLCKSEFGSL